VIPVESGKDFTKIYLPKGNWYDLYTDKKEDGGKEEIIELKAQILPVYVKESSIIPMQTLVQSTAIAPSDTLLLHIYKGALPNTYTYYEDDGKSFEYEKGSYYKRNITYDPAANKIIFQKADGKMDSKFTNIALILHGFDGQQKISVNGNSVQLQSNMTSLLSPISKFDPQGAGKAADGSKTLTTVFKNSNGNITVDL
jgi:alpha-glucosidase